MGICRISTMILIAKEGELAPWGNSESSEHSLTLRPNDGGSHLQGRKVLIRIAVRGFLPLAGGPDQGHCREAPSAYTPSSSLSLFMGVNTNDHKWTHGTKSTTHCIFLWPKVEDMRAQMVLSSSEEVYRCLRRVWVGADVFCKLTAGCITVAVVGALAFITVVTSMGYGLLAKMEFQE